MSTSVSKLLETKGGAIVSVGPDETVFAAIQTMGEKGVGALLVLDEKGKLEGILSERDCFRKAILQERPLREVKVWEIMTREVVTVTGGQTLEDCMAMMTRRRIRHLPVMKGDRILGVISMRDVVRHLCEEQNLMIANLEKYIGGSL